MGSLWGKAQVTLDSKGRISLPAKYRRLLPEEVVITKSPNKEYPSLAIYTEEGFEQWIQEVIDGKGGRPATSQFLDDIIEEFGEAAETVRIDGAGRMLIPSEHRDYAQVEKEVVITGVRDHLVIRSVAIWEANSERRSKISVYDDAPAGLNANAQSQG